MAKGGLGRGLGSLIPGADPETSGPDTIPIDQIRPNQAQPRQYFDEDALRDLVLSIEKHGIVQPVVARKRDEGYELITGERRWRAAREAGLSAIPAIVKDSDDSESLQLALVENIQRENLNGLEEAGAYRRLMDEFDLSQTELAAVVGKSRTAVANTLRLLGLPEETKQLVLEDRLSAGHARALLGLKDAAEQTALAGRIINEGLSVRQTEQLVRVWDLAREKAGKKKVPLPPEIRTLAKKIGRTIGTKVRAKLVRDRVRIEIDLNGLEDLEDLEAWMAGIGPRADYRPPDSRDLS